MKRSRPTFINFVIFVFMVAAIYFLTGNVAYLMAKFSVPDHVLPYINTVLLILPPLLYYYLIVYRSGVRLGSIVPIIALNLTVSRFLMPVGVRPLLLLAALLEVVIVVKLLWRLTRLLRNYLQLRNFGKSRIAAARETGEQLLREIQLNPVYRYVLIELSLFYYIYKNLKNRKLHSDGRLINDLQGVYDLVLALTLLTIIEIVPVHVLLYQYSHVAAWAVTILSLYTLIWFWGDYSALRLKHSYIENNMFHIRVGTRVSAVAPVELIKSCEFGEYIPKELKSKTFLNGSVGKKGNLLIKFKQPVKAITMFGIEKLFTEITLKIVNIEDLEPALRPCQQTGNVDED